MMIVASTDPICVRRKTVKASIKKQSAQTAPQVYSRRPSNEPSIFNIIVWHIASTAVPLDSHTPCDEPQVTQVTTESDMKRTKDPKTPTFVPAVVNASLTPYITAKFSGWGVGGGGGELKCCLPQSSDH